MYDQEKFDFMEELPRRPSKPERLFLGIFPDESAADAADRARQMIWQDLGLTGRALEIDRYHTSLVHISDRKRVRSKDIFTTELAAAAVSISPFELTFDRMGSFPGVPKKGRPLEHPLVLLAEEGPVRELHQMLGTELRKFRLNVPEQFRPHLTLAYNRKFVPIRPIDPIAFVVTEFVLVHSRLWLTEYKILRKWTLH